MSTLYKYYIQVSILLFLMSCIDKHIIEYKIKKGDNDAIQLTSWHILGPIKNAEDTISFDLLEINYLETVGFSDSLFANDPFDIKINIPEKLQIGNTFFNGVYQSEEPIIDFNQIKYINKNDSLINGSAIYFYCNINADNDSTIYLLARSTNKMKIWLDSEAIFKSDTDKSFELSYSEFIPLNLKKGNNTLVIKRINLSHDAFFEGILCNKETMVEYYSKAVTGIIIYPSIILNDTLSFIRDHQRVLDTVLDLSLYNLNDGSLTSHNLGKSTNLSIPNLKNNCSYYAYFKVGNQTFSQPFYKGNPNEALHRFIQKQSEIKDSILLIQTNALIYRLGALLDHSSKESDWWWQLKVSNVVYELDNLYKNFNNKAEFMEHSFGIHLKAYFSKLDNTPQYYLLVTPDKLSSTEKIPLVLVLRPDIESHHHFLTSPQIARYWSLTNAKYLANKYRYAIVMPASRLYANEVFTPMAEAETLQVLDDVKIYCNIDVNKIYLHGNCSAGYRSLSFACRYPNKFAAIGLYSPIYKTSSSNEWIMKNSPQANLKTLRETPIMLHFDPNDSHIHPDEIRSLFKDSRKNDINLFMSSSFLSGLHYNVLLVGEEAFSFFKGKEKNSFEVEKEDEDKLNQKKIIADLFSKPFIFVYESTNESKEYKQFVDAIKCEYESYLFSPAPMVNSESLSFHDIINKNIFLIGSDFNNNVIKELISKLDIKIDNNLLIINKLNYNISGSMYQAVFDNPYNNNGSIVVYSSNAADRLSHVINKPWINGLASCIVQKK